MVRSGAGKNLLSGLRRKKALGDEKSKTLGLCLFRNLPFRILPQEMMAREHSALSARRPGDRCISG
jgi:hypothetical protein